MADESYVQIAPESTGKKVRNLKVTTLVPDATTGIPAVTTVYIQAVAIADDQGNVINDFIDYSHNERLIQLLTEIRNGIAELLGHTLEA